MSIASANPDPLCISSQHPSLPGHFPGNPIVPGVVILNCVLEALKTDFPGWESAGIRKLKFLQPLRPDQAFTLRWSEIKNDGLRFKCLLAADATTIVEGNIKLRRHGD